MNFINEFGRSYLASGAENYFGQGWNNQRLIKAMPGSGKKYAVDVFRTSTIPGIIGNMPLNEKLQPLELWPKCIKVNFRHASVLNAVELSGPPFLELLLMGRWQKMVKRFGLSIMSIGPTKEIRLKETELFVKMIIFLKKNYLVNFFVKKNYTCPNTEHETQNLIKEISKDAKKLYPLREAGIHIGAKINIFTSTEVMKEIEQSKVFSFITCSNAISWHDLPEWIQKKCFGSTISPLDHLGGGGFSGPDILPFVLQWIRKQREAGIEIPILASNGIQKTRDVIAVRDAGGSGIEIGSVKIVRPHRRQRIIDCSNSISWHM